MGDKGIGPQRDGEIGTARIWFEEVFNYFVRKALTVDTPNLFSFVNIASIAINSTEDNEQLVRTLAERLTQYSSRVDLNRVQSHLEEIKRGYRFQKFPVIDVTAKLTYRGLIGASSEFGKTAFEIGLYFEPIFNVPYIPGSSIKGAVKAAARAVNALSNKIEELFGKGSVGRLDFSDAYPVGAGVKNYLLIPDVMAPHYSKGGQDILREDEAKVTPIPFMAIAPETRFRFLIADREGRMDETTALQIVTAIAVAFSSGLGAKTSIGYGIFDLEKASLTTGD